MKKIILFLGLFVFSFAGVKINEPSYTCEIFNSAVTSFDTVKIVGSNNKIVNSYINAKKLLGKDIECNRNDCLKNEIPVNKLNVSFMKNTKETPIPFNYTFTLNYYKDYDFYNPNLSLHFFASQPYNDSNKKFMRLGSYSFNGVNYNLYFNSGDYYFDNLVFNNKNLNIFVNGKVRIFVKNDLNISNTNFYINKDSDTNNLLIYVGNELNIKNNNRKESVINGFIYTKGDTNILTSKYENFKLIGALTSEGNITLGSNQSYYYKTADELGYGICPLCYALRKDGKFINFFDFITMHFNFPRKIGFINQGNSILKDLKVTQFETNPAWLSLKSPEMYAIKDQDDKIINNDINNTITYKVGKLSYSHTKSGKGTVTRWAPSINIKGILNTELNTTAYFGNYNPTGFEKYYTIDTYGIDGEFIGGDNLNFYADYKVDDRHYKIKISYCKIEDSNNSNQQAGPFDAWDMNKNINDRNITTKIVGKMFTLFIASLNKDNNALETVKGKFAKFALWDMNKEINITKFYDFQAYNNPYIYNDFVVNNAYKNVRVIFKFCAKKNNGRYEFYPYDKCTYECKDNNDNSLCIRKQFSSDNFAIRPDKFVITNIPSKIKSGEDFNITIKAVAFNSNIPVNNYNETLKIDNKVSPTLTYAETKKNCVTGKLISIPKEINFKNGIATLKLNYNEVGDINLTIKEINGSEFAKIDNDDTNWNKRKIKEDTQIINIKPYNFEINATLKNYKNYPFTYISNDLNMSSVLNLSIKAVNKENKVTKNYSDKCYAKNIDINMSHSIPKNNLDIIYAYNNKYKRKNYQIIKLNNISKNIFKNGIANLKILINFERYPNKFEKKFNFKINDVNISDGTLFANKIASGVAQFRYGMLKTNDITIFSIKKIDTTIQYEYFDDKWKINEEHNTSDLGNILYEVKPTDIKFKIKTINGVNIKNGVEQIEISTTHALPYSAKIHLAIPSWLWYHPLAKTYSNPSATNLDCLTHPCIKVTFLKSGSGWAGVGKENSKYNENNKTIKVNLSKEINVTKKEVKKLNW